MQVMLQGGGEFTPDCRAMDRDLLARAEHPIVLVPLAAEPGADYASAGRRGQQHFAALGAPDVAVAPDVREDAAGSLAAVRASRTVVLPGGSPSRLLTALTASPIGGLLRDLVAAGGTVVGASAGAMVLCEVTVLPDRRGADGPRLAAGLGLVPGCAVLPHWYDGSSRPDWLRALAERPDLRLLGLPEHSGVWYDGARLTAVGKAATALLQGVPEGGTLLAVGATTDVR
jgi:cyanophycinase-like exopeptidase